MEKIAQVFETDIVELLRNPAADEKEVNLSILEKIKQIDSLEEAEKQFALLLITHVTQDFGQKVFCNQNETTLK